VQEAPISLHISKSQLLKIGLHVSISGMSCCISTKDPKEIKWQEVEVILNMSQEIFWSDSLRTMGIFGTFV